MKKDIEWLKKEIDELFNGRSILIVGKSVVDEIFNQLDEPEVLSQDWIDENMQFGRIASGIAGDDGMLREYVLASQLENLLVPNQEWLEENETLYKKLNELEYKIAELDEYNSELIRDNNQLRTQLEESNTLSQEWIDGNKEPFHHFETEKVDYYVSADLLQNLLVSKQEEVKVPQVVADWIEDRRKSGFVNSDIIELIFGIDALSDLEVHVVDDPLKKYLNKGNEYKEKIVRAVILNNYEVEEEQKYYAKIKGWELFVDFVGAKYWGVVSSGGRLGFVSIDGAKERTKEEWNELGINEDNADFVKVEEME